MSPATTEFPAASAAGPRTGESPELPPYSHELSWPKGMAPFKVVDDGTQGDPYAHYAWMRENAPVLRAHSPVSDVWFISRYDDVRRAMRAPKVFSSQVVDPVPLTFLTLFDAPNHTRLRQVVAQAFIPKAIARFEDRVRENAEKYLAPMLDAGGGDAVDDYAIPLSMSTISALLDVPAEDFDKMKFWSDETFSYFGRLARNAQGTGTDEQSTFEFFAYLKDTMERLYRGRKRLGRRSYRPDVEGRTPQREGGQGTLRLCLRRRTRHHHHPAGQRVPRLQ